MALLGDVAGLGLCITGIAYKNLTRSIKSRHALNAAAYLHGMDRPTATKAEVDLVREKMLWDIKSKKYEYCSPDMAEFLENGVKNSLYAKDVWATCAAKQSFEDAGINPDKAYNIIRGHNYMQDFQKMFSRELYYWDTLKQQGLKYSDVFKKCPTCGHEITDPAEPCPVCGAPAQLKAVITYTRNEEITQEACEDVAARLQDGVNRAIKKENIKGAIITACIVVAFMLFYIFVINPLH